MINSSRSIGVLLSRISGVVTPILRGTLPMDHPFKSCTLDTRYSDSPLNKQKGLKKRSSMVQRSSCHLVTTLALCLWLGSEVSSDRLMAQESPEGKARAAYQAMEGAAGGKVQITTSPSHWVGSVCCDYA